MTSVTPADFAKAPGDWRWAACGASVTGSDHQRRGLGCDDAFGFGVAGDFVVATVADGAGSVTGTSAWGAHAATQRILERALNQEFIRDFTADPALHQAQMRWLFEQALEAVRTCADARRLDISLLATTLGVAISDRTHTMFGQIGDSVIAAEIDGQITTLLVESKDEYANTTRFLQSDNVFEESFQTAARAGVTAFALSTDGMSYKITDIATGRAYEPFFRGSWQHVRAGADSAHFAALLRGIEHDQTGDDKTVVLAALRWEDDEFYPSSLPVHTTIVSSPAPELRSLDDTEASSAEHDSRAQVRPRWFGGRKRQ